MLAQGRADVRIPASGFAITDDASRNVTFGARPQRSDCDSTG